MAVVKGSAGAAVLVSKMSAKLPMRRSVPAPRLVLRQLASQRRRIRLTAEAMYPARDWVRNKTPPMSKAAKNASHHILLRW